jgi:hypothetical protein
MIGVANTVNIDVFQCVDGLIVPALMHQSVVGADLPAESLPQPFKLLAEFLVGEAESDKKEATRY